jgi:hypothetical protein
MMSPEAATSRLTAIAENLDDRTFSHDPTRERLDIEFLRALAAQLAEASTHRHKKRGTEYVLIGIGRMQAENWLDQLHPANATGFAFAGPAIVSVDMREVAIYRSTDDGSFWVRPREEFEDGRFEALKKEADGTKPS